MNEDQRLLPARPDLGEPGPEEAVGRSDPEAGLGLLIHGKPMPECEDLKRQGAVCGREGRGERERNGQ